jgi:ABC-type antimicrobial peptide transport system permease subunit
MVALTTALRGLAANKLRSVLTMLGIIIGVGAVIFSIGMTQGSKAALAESIQRLGTNVITVFPGQQRRGQVSFGFGSTNTLTLEDAQAVLRSCPSVARVSPQVNSRAQVKYKNRNTNTSVNGTGEDYPVISNHFLAQGRYFTQAEVKQLKRVAILGSTTAKDLFDQQSPIGKSIRVKGTSFQVIGVFQEKGGMGFRNPDDAVYVPVTTAMRRLFGMENVQTITAQARDMSLMDKAQDEMDQVLRRRHKIPTGGQADFIMFNQADLAQTQGEQQDNISFIVYIMGLLSLVVGGIGIMNIMLVSVTERTREIGIRKAIGAKRSNILSQFLLESLILSVSGGLLGVPAGILVANAMGEIKQWKIIHDPTTVVFAFSFSLVVGVFFGLYPAFKASKLNPIEALRYE